jgi:hypothetical protein
VPSQPRGHDLEYLFFALIPNYFAHIHFLAQFVLALRAQVAQGNMTQQQALERFSLMHSSSAHPFQEQSPQQLPPGSNAGGMPSGTTQQQFTTLSQRAQVSTNSQVTPPERAIQAQDPPPPLPGAQQVSGPSGLASLPLPQLRALFTHLLRIVMEGEKNLQTASGPGEGYIQGQGQLRAKVENHKRYLLALQEVINAKARAR